MSDVFEGLMIPFLGTALGAGCVFFLKDTLNRSVQRGLTGFAAGVMVAASVWSLLIPAMEGSADLGQFAFVPAVVGFWAGTLFLLVLDHIIPHLHMNAQQAEGPHSRLSRTTMLVLAVTLHNIPEGMAVGAIYAGWLSGSEGITLGAALALSRYCHPELSRGGDHLDAAACGGDGKVARLCGRRPLGGGRADRRRADRACNGTHRAHPALCTFLRGGRDDLRRGGGTDSGDERGRALEHRRALVCGGLYAHDDARCRARINTHRKRADRVVGSFSWKGMLAGWEYLRLEKWDVRILPYK